jgi:hypothetical protein
VCSESPGGTLVLLPNSNPGFTAKRSVINDLAHASGDDATVFHIQLISDFNEPAVGCEPQPVQCLSFQVIALQTPVLALSMWKHISGRLGGTIPYAFGTIIYKQLCLDNGMDWFTYYFSGSSIVHFGSGDAE